MSRGLASGHPDASTVEAGHSSSPELGRHRNLRLLGYIGDTTNAYLRDMYYYLINEGR